MGVFFVLCGESILRGFFCVLRWVFFGLNIVSRVKFPTILVFWSAYGVVLACFFVYAIIGFLSILVGLLSFFQVLLMICQ